MIINIINQSKKLKLDYAYDLVRGMRLFAVDVATAWDMKNPEIHFSNQSPYDKMRIYLVDEFVDKTLTGILGYHILENGIPIGYVNVSLCSSIFGDTHIPAIGTPTDTFYHAPTDIVTPFSVSEVLSHELAEMMIDPFLNRFSESVDKKFWRMEIADPADDYRYVKRIDWVERDVHYYRYMTFQDFVYPSFYEPDGKPPFSYTGGVKKPFNLDGGYENIIGANKKETTVLPSESKKEPWLSAAGVELRRQVNLRWPNRRKDSDGWIGDAAHAKTISDHNPDPITGVVRAIDIDAHIDVNDPSIAMQIADSLRMDELNKPHRSLFQILKGAPKPEKRISYIIYNHHITSGTYRKTFWTWRRFDGDPHTSHIHVSFLPDGDHDSRPFL